MQLKMKRKNGGHKARINPIRWAIERILKFGFGYVLPHTEFGNTVFGSLCCCFFVALHVTSFVVSVFQEDAVKKKMILPISKRYFM